MRKSTDKKMITGYVLSVLAFLLVVAVFGAGMISFARKADSEGAQTLKKGIQRASVQCYAIEGRYPPNVAYLEENYGITIDRERYHVFYSGFASNIMPDITVNKIEENEEN